MDKIYYVIRLFILASLVILPTQVLAQVTIGSNIKPNSGALLDLKEQATSAGNVNANRGLVLPRVNLTDMDNLYPMFESITTPGTPNSSYMGSLKATEDHNHMGLLVFNMNMCNGFGKGVYTWNGTKWRPMGKVNAIPEAGIFATNTEARWIGKDTMIIHIPSGKDLRPFPSDNKFSLSMGRDEASSNGTIINITEPLTSANSGLRFINSTIPNGWESPFTDNPKVFEYYLADMSEVITNDNPNKSNPFRSWETAITFETPINECNQKGLVTVCLNQTNYRLTIKRENGTFNDMYRFRSRSSLFPSGANYYRFIITGDSPNFTQETNARFYSNYTTETSGIISDIKVPVTGGKELIDGTIHLETIRPTYNASSAAGKRSKTAGILTYTDTATVARFYPVEMHLIQCNVYDYETTNIEDGDVLPVAQWGQKILKHTDQNNNPFYSADFGNAGRWMITNLAATTYDSESGLTSTQDQPVPYVTIPFGDYDNGVRKYAYPVTNKGTSDNTDWGIRPADWRWEEGLFYNWFAATGRPYDSNNVAEGNTDQALVQGICPNGWYLPSDKDWADLEKEVYANLGKYSVYDAEDIMMFGTPAWNPIWDDQKLGYTRGNPIENGHVGHGAAMKDICLPKGSAFSYIQSSKSYSKEYYQGGFNATLVGRMKAESEGSEATSEQLKVIQRARAYNVDYWTSSQNSVNDAWFRGFQLTQGGVQRTTYIKAQLQSVRCKKKP